jgi:hypothetical protein
MRYAMLVRYSIKGVSSAQLKELVDNCGRASMVISPTHSNLWDVNVCLKDEEIDNIRKLGFHYEKIPG